MLDFIDCQAQAIGAGGYQALAAPGSTLSLVLTGFLTLFVAFFGYRLLFGQSPSVRDGVLGSGQDRHRAGAGDQLDRLSHPGLRRRAEGAGGARRRYRPARPALPGAGGGLVDRLAFADRAFELLAIEGTAGCRAGGRAGPARRPPVSTPGATPEMFPGFNSFALGGARVAFLTGALGALALVRLVAGLLLALGPFFIAFLLFEGTRGLFEGWVRVLAGAALGALGTAIVLGVELALLEPWLADLLSPPLCGPADPRRAGRIARRHPAVRPCPCSACSTPRRGSRSASGCRRPGARRRRSSSRRCAASGCASPAPRERRRRAGRGPVARRRGGRRGQRHASAARLGSRRPRLAAGAAGGTSSRTRVRGARRAICRRPRRRRSARASAAAPPPASPRARADGTLPDEEADTRSARRLLCRSRQLGPQPGRRAARLAPHRLVDRHRRRFGRRAAGDRPDRADAAEDGRALYLARRPPDRLRPGAEAARSRADRRRSRR